MQIHLNLLENSIEYFIDSLDLYIIANEDGEHDQRMSTLNNKKKWKTTFVFIVQAIELLMKESLCRLNPALVFESIDNSIDSSSKTVSFSKLLVRFNNFFKNALSVDEMMFLKTCANIRNSFIHYNVEISSPDLKSKYCKLISLFIRLYEQTIEEAFNYKNKGYKDLTAEIIAFDEQYTIFRGMELTFESKEELLREIEVNRRYPYFINNDGIKHLRVKFGEENDFLKKNLRELRYSSYDDFDYCADCAAEKGEYHLDKCDWEICPICFRQALSCDCETELCDENGNTY
jgi:hypothetical protein